MVAWTLVFHILGLVFWLGSLLVVTHVLAMHTEETAAEGRAALSRLELKLFKGLAHPGAALMIISGIILVGQDPNSLRQHWLHIKLALVLILIVLDLRVYLRMRAFQSGEIEMTRRECMLMHGAIALVFSGILIMVLVKPFGLHRRQMGSARPGVAAWVACCPAGPASPAGIQALPVRPAVGAESEQSSGAGV